MTSYAPDVTEYPVIVGPRWTDLFDEPSVQKAWDESLHPRGHGGLFVESGTSTAPSSSPAVDNDWGIDTSSQSWHDTLDDIREQGMGNCYQSGATLMLNAHALGLKNPTLIHATCLGTGGQVKGLRYGHAWLEVDGPDDAGGRLVLDFSSGHSAILPAVAYHALGRAEDIHSYSEAETSDMLWKTRNYGPWGWTPPNTRMLDANA